ncbi:sensor histidine kinase [Aquibium microcysteis]|uniref:sensor histidine kinase n=1 Tax=Aquibium microcysteis TaxID=675281 RepID=UPI00165CF0A8|nr:HWE histidine kinase domain-containing protein [Aquibium microcysteis]
MKTIEEISAGADTFLSDAGALADGLRLGGAGIWRWRIDGDRLQWTRNLETVHHLPPGSFDGSLASFQRDLHPEDAEGVWRKINACIQTGDPYRAVYRTAPRPDGAEVWIETAGGIVQGADGARYLTGVCQDVSARVRNERQLKRILGQQRAVARFGSFALGRTDLQGVLDEAVRLAAEVLDVPLTKILQFADAADHLMLRAGIGWADGLVGQGKVGIDRDSQAGFTLLDTAPVIVRDLRSEKRFTGPQLLHDHGVRSGVSVTIPGPEARPFGVFGIHSRDVRTFDDADAEFLQSLAHIVAGAARQAAAADHRLLLMREMAHRAGNMLQLVNSIASQTFGADADAQTARRSFSDRLSALARSNYVVARGGWSSTPFAELVAETLKPFGDRVTAEGRNVLLPPELCFDLGLVLHELATNSMKYGTLGRRKGTVRVGWAFRLRDDGTRVFVLDWDDADAAARPATGGSGFGSKLIGALVERKWNGVLRHSEGPTFGVGMEIPVAD